MAGNDFPAFGNLRSGGILFPTENRILNFVHPGHLFRVVIDQFLGILDQFKHLFFSVIKGLQKFILAGDQEASFPSLHIND